MSLLLASETDAWHGSVQVIVDECYMDSDCETAQCPMSGLVYL
jgi:hypothetical protein